MMFIVHNNQASWDAPKECPIQCADLQNSKFVLQNSIENRIYVRGEFRESLSMNLLSPFQPEREFKVYKSCKCSQIICRTVD